MPVLPQYCIGVGCTASVPPQPYCIHGGPVLPLYPQRPALGPHGTAAVPQVYNISRVTRKRRIMSAAYVNGARLDVGARGVPLRAGDVVHLGMHQNSWNEGTALKLVVEEAGPEPAAGGAGAGTAPELGAEPAAGPSRRHIDDALYWYCSKPPKQAVAPGAYRHVLPEQARPS